MWQSLHPEVQGALIGVGALGGAWVGRAGFDYLKYKIVGNGKCNGGKHCSDHQSIVETLAKLESNYEDEKQVDLYVRAIQRANGGNGHDGGKDS